MAGFKPSEEESPIVFISGLNPNNAMPERIIFLCALLFVNYAAEFAI